MSTPTIDGAFGEVEAELGVPARGESPAMIHADPSGSAQGEAGRITGMAQNPHSEEAAFDVTRQVREEYLRSQEAGDLPPSERPDAEPMPRTPKRQEARTTFDPMRKGSPSEQEAAARRIGKAESPEPAPEPEPEAEEDPFFAEEKPSDLETESAPQLGIQELVNQQAELMRERQALAGATRLLQENPVVALEHLGVSRDQLAQQLGVTPAGMAQPQHPSPIQLDEDADPALRAMADQMQHQQSLIQQLTAQIQGQTQHLQQRDAAREASQRQVAREGLLAGVRSKLSRSVSASPRLKGPLGDSMAENVMLEIEQNIENLPQDPDQLYGEAVNRMRARVKKYGLSKEAKARAAKKARSRGGDGNPVPTQAGRTARPKPIHPVDDQGVDYSNDDQRLAASMKYMEALARRHAQ